MTAKIFIVAFTAIFWQAQSQLYDCSTQNPCAVSTPVQNAAPFPGNNCFPPILVPLGLKSNVIPTPPAISTRPLNLCLEDESPDFIFGLSRCAPVPNIPGPCIPDIPQISPIADETCRPNICANDCSNIPKPMILLRPNLPNWRSNCALEGSLDSPCPGDISTFRVSPEANSCLGPICQVTPKLPNPIFGINRVAPNPCGFESPLTIEPCRPVSNTGKVNVPSNVQTTTTTETTTVSNAGSPVNNQRTIISTSNAESSSSVNVRPDSYTPSVFRGFNQPSVSSIATSEATAAVTTPATYSSNIFGTNITPAQTSVATAESTVTTSNIGPTNVFSPTSGVFNNLRPATVTATANSEATSVTTSNVVASNANVESSSFANVRAPGIWPTNYFGGINVGPSGLTSACSDSSAFTNSPSNIFTSRFPGPLSPVIQASSIAAADAPISIGLSNACLSNTIPYSTTAFEPACSANVSPFSRVFSPNYLAGCSSIAQPTVSSAASSEALSSTNAGPLYGGSTTTSYVSSESTSSMRPTNPLAYGGFNNFGPQSSASTCADSSSSIIGCSNRYMPNVVGFNNIAIPSPVSSVANTEAASFTSVSPSNIPASFNPCVFRNNIVSPDKVATTCGSLGADIVPVVSVAPNFCGGIPQTVCLSEPTVGPACLEPPLFYPSSCRPTGVLKNVMPQTCAYETFLPSGSVFEVPQPSLVSCLNPLAASINELSEFISSVVPIIQIVDTIGPSCSNPCNFPPTPLPTCGGLGPTYPLDRAFNSAGSCAEALTLVEPQGVTTTSTTSSTSASTMTDINNPFTPCDDEVISSSSASSSTTVVVEEIVPVAECLEVIEPVVSCMAGTPALSVSSPSVLCESPYNIGLPPVTLEVEIPSSFASILSSNLGVCPLPTALSSCLPISTSPVVYELQIPSSIPAQLSCTLGSVSSTVPVLYMNVEPIGMCSC